ncbi:LysE type translocator [Rubritalea squalenifaciens DSM 18772]|uniref:LysE type translocator n=1 Tax=Rubritalea squalenifaciens DSM 18772 TaxID=1123071 RepID=A0A1M6HSE5_9BACT|nr:LysE family transporter [Rubritalea squalenifaciens]SHJ25119.1 LysE type translocator [Rubritalea squalenifaciens DSM 18772]
MDLSAVISEWMAFAGVMALGQFSPGPDMLLLTRTALAKGWKAGCATALGIALGLGIHSAIALFGLAALLMQGGIVSIGLTSAAVLYLLWLGWQLFREAWSNPDLRMGNPEYRSEESFWKSWRRGFLCNLLNPKVAVFLAGVVMPFLGTASGSSWALVLWLTIVFEGMILWCLWACLLQMKGVKAAYKRLSRWVDALFGAILWILAAFLISSLI